MSIRSLQLRISLVFLGLLGLVMLLVLALVARSSDQIIAAELERELGAGSRVFGRLIEQSRLRLETAAGLLSADFAFREAIATRDRPTVLSVLRNHGARIGTQVMMVIRPDGVVIADTQSPAQEPTPFAFPDLLEAAEIQGRVSDFRVLADGRLYQLVIVPVLAPVRIAWVAMGFPVDDQWARELSATTGLQVSAIARNGNRVDLLASSLEVPASQELALAVAPLAENAYEVLSLSDQRYQTLMLSMGHGTVVALQRSMEQAESAFRSLRNALLAILIGGATLFAIGSIWLARRIASPVNALAEAAGKIEAGDYSHAVPPGPPDEIGLLASSFDRMRVGIAAREAEILKLAYGDPLTGLPNRTRFIEVLGRLSPHCSAAVIVLDIDRFALINDALGHPVGDRLLAETGRRLAGLMPASGLLARLGGDEFAILLHEADAAAVRGFVESVVAALSEPMQVDDQRLDVGGSLGIALYPGDGQDANTLLRRTELAMYEAKRRQSGFAFAADLTAEPPHEQLSLIGEMREALLRDEFVVYYQPKLGLATDQIVGAEALLRWQHPERGLVPPGRFIPFAEQTGFIREITPWLLDRVARQAAEWRAEGMVLVLSVNLSTRDLLNPKLVATVQQALQGYRLEAGQLCLEITESALMEDPDLAQRHLQELAALGVKLSIDDYGVGQASLAYVKTLPVHEIKIDQFFVRSLLVSPKDAAIVRSTVALGHALGLSVVAEGAETEADLVWLRESGCDVVQGYVLARPMPSQELPAWVSARG